MDGGVKDFRGSEDCGDQNCGDQNYGDRNCGSQNCGENNVAVELFATNIPGKLGYYPRDEIFLIGSEFQLLVSWRQDSLIGLEVLLRQAIADVELHGHHDVSAFVCGGDCLRDLTNPNDEQAISQVGVLLKHVNQVFYVAGFKPGTPIAHARVAEDFGSSARASSTLHSGVVGNIGDCTSTELAHRLSAAGECIAENIDAFEQRFRRLALSDRGGKDVGKLQRETSWKWLQQRAESDVNYPIPLDRRKDKTLIQRYYRQWREALISLVASVETREMESYANEGRNDGSYEGRYESAEVERFLSELAEDEPLVALIRPLCDYSLRDLSIGLTDSAIGSKLARLWLLFARALNDEARANALACYAMERYLRGATPIAWAALRVAREAYPGHNLTRILTQMICAGMEPETLTQMLKSVSELFEELEIEEPLLNSQTQPS